MNFVLVIVNTCGSQGLVAMLGTLKDLDKGFEKDNHDEKEVGENHLESSF